MTRWMKAQLKESKVRMQRPCSECGAEIGAQCKVWQRAGSNYNLRLLPISHDVR